MLLFLCILFYISSVEYYYCIIEVIKPRLESQALRNHVSYNRDLLHIGIYQMWIVEQKNEEISKQIIS